VDKWTHEHPKRSVGLHWRHILYFRYTLQRFCRQICNLATTFLESYLCCRPRLL